MIRARGVAEIDQASRMRIDLWDLEDLTAGDHGWLAGNDVIAQCQ